MKHDKGFLAANPMPPTEAEKAALAGVVRAIRNMPRGTFITIEDDGTVTLCRRETPGFGRSVGVARVGSKRVSL